MFVCVGRRSTQVGFRTTSSVTDSPLVADNLSNSPKSGLIIFETVTNKHLCESKITYVAFPCSRCSSKTNKRRARARLASQICLIMKICTYTIAISLCLSCSGFDTSTIPKTRYCRGIYGTTLAPSTALRGSEAAKMQSP